MTTRRVAENHYFSNTVPDSSSWPWRKREDSA